MDTLTAAFCDVMYQYQLPFTLKGVEANLNVWRENKAPLLELLRRHPNWKEQELAVVFGFSEGRGIDHDAVDENKFEMMLFAQEVGLSDGDLADFQAALDAATADYATVPDVSRLIVIRGRGGIKCAEGQKASRIINRLCCKFGLDQYAVEKETVGDDGVSVRKRVKPYNAAFARLADSLNPIQIPKTGILSIHPCDFLEMSSRRNSWQSCHRLDGGGYRGGCQSYMGDGVSMIFFTVEDSVKNDFYHAARLTREIFCYKDGLLLQSRLYPNNNDDIRKLYRGLVQNTIAQCLGVPNLWKVKIKKDEVLPHLETAKDSLHYQDYEYGYGIVSLLRGTSGEQKITIGSPSLCTCCGRPHFDESFLKCRECDPVVVCKGCGKTVPQFTSHYMDGAYYCGECVSCCSSCGVLTENRYLHPAIGRNGRLVRLCEQCYARTEERCGLCGSRNICRIIGGERFCNAGYAAMAEAA